MHKLLAPKIRGFVNDTLADTALVPNSTKAASKKEYSATIVIHVRMLVWGQSIGAYALEARVPCLPSAAAARASGRRPARSSAQTALWPPSQPVTRRGKRRRFRVALT
eukprot:6206636-Pleurochrysis_carterae.AAC.3